MLVLTKVEQWVVDEFAALRREIAALEVKLSGKAATVETEAKADAAKVETQVVAVEDEVKAKL